MVKPDVGRQAADGCRVPHTWLVATADDPHLHIPCYETSLILFPDSWPRGIHDTATDIIIIHLFYTLE